MRTTAPVVHLIVGLPGAGKTTFAPEQTVPMSDAELAQWRAQFQAPDDDELRGAGIPPVPPGYATWSAWASWRWPSLPDLAARGTAG